MKPVYKRVLGLAAVAAIGLAVPASAATIYTETFPSGGNTGTGNASNDARFDAAGWVDGGGASATGGARIGVYAEGFGGFTNDRDGTTNADGIAYVYRANGQQASAVYTTEQAIDPAVYEDDVTFDWDQRGAFNGAGAGSRLAVQVGGSWYVSSTFFAAGGDNEAAWAARQLVYSPAAANWLTLTMGSTTAVPVVGPAATSDLVGNITGFGLFAGTTTATSNETIEFDQLTVTATPVPEPAAVGSTLAVAGSGLLARRRRRTA